MALVVNDIRVGTDNDLFIYNGDFKVSASDDQHIEHIIRTYLSSWKEYPLLGVGIDFYRGSSGQAGKLRREITTHLTSDGYQVGEILIKGENSYFIDAIRIKNGKI